MYCIEYTRCRVFLSVEGNGNGIFSERKCFFVAIILQDKDEGFIFFQIIDFISFDFLNIAEVMIRFDDCLDILCFLVSSS